MPICVPARAVEVLRADFDAANRYGTLWISVWHPFLSGRLARLHAVVELVDYMRSREGVWFTQVGEICDHVVRLRGAGAWQPMIEQLAAVPT